MARITREQIQKINEKCSNHWELDDEYYIFHNEKTLIKKIDLDNEHYLEFTLRYNYKNQISLHISKFFHKKDDYFATSNGLGKSKIIDNTEYTRKNVNNLIDFTKKLNDEELMTINAMTEVTKTPIFVASEEF
jgi:hypothetical protein